ncbi:hypothetical protein [Holdemania sp. 1001302B_160321_E10]|jgi:hypothetical protein|uniref:hypothetical protein n=1 Tax=Holdemania sp. 1001302B_160321_E10 TaxID=2787120 RepID=UPI00189B6070|nr:hypothetical protein [Holdemania sp. 1001302B_160321_E10]
MQLAKIEFNLSPDSTAKAKEKLIALKKELGNINDIFLHRSMEFICERIQKNIEETTGNGIYQVTGTLLNEFGPDKVIYEGKTLATLISHCGYSAFVEYGTGIVGASDPHPNAGSDGWQYDTNGHGEEGWYYLDKAGKLHFTAGMPAHRFLYNAVNDYLAIYKQIYFNVMKERMDALGI